MSAFRIAALIPTYNNPGTIRAVVCAVRVYLDQVLVVDDGSAPEVLEELDADYVPTAKARKITPKQAIIQALDALKAGDIDTAQCILTEALK